MPQREQNLGKHQQCTTYVRLGSPAKFHEFLTGQSPYLIKKKGGGAGGGGIVVTEKFILVCQVIS